MSKPRSVRSLASASWRSFSRSGKFSSPSSSICEMLTRQPASRYSLPIRGQHPRRGKFPQDRPRLEESPRELVDVRAGQRSKPARHPVIEVCRGRRGELQRVRDQSRQETQRHRAGWFEVRHLKKPRHDRRRRTHGFIDEPDRLTGNQIAADAVMVEHLDDLGLVRSGDGLRKFIVIDQDQSRTRQLNQIGLRHSDQRSGLFLDHRKQWLRRMRDRRDNPIDQLARAKRGNSESRTSETRREHRIGPTVVAVSWVQRNSATARSRALPINSIAKPNPPVSRTARTPLSVTCRWIRAVANDHQHRSTGNRFRLARSSRY